MVTEAKNHTVAGALIAAREPMERTGRVVLAVTAAAFIVIAIPLLWRRAFVLQPCACTDAVDTRGACWRTLVQRCR